MSASLGSNIISTTRKVAESVSKQRPGPREARITNVDIIDHKVDADFELPVGEVVISSRSIVTPYAGDGYGFICSPREDQAVITLPIDSDYNKSVILGRVYNNDTEGVPVHNQGDVLFRHQLGHQWSFTYTQPVTGELNLDVANQLNLTLVEDESTTSQLKFMIASDTITTILPDEIVRVVLDYQSDDALYSYLNVRIEWEARVEYNTSNEPFIIISDANTVVGGPLY